MSMRYKGECPVVRCGPGRVKQEYAKRSDIKDIVARYKKSGFLENLAKARPVFADVSKVPDFQTVVGKLRSAEEAFSLLPARVRSRFVNDPARLVAFLQDRSNDAEAVKLGLRVAPPKPAPVVPQK